MRQAPALFTHGSLTGVDGARILKVLTRQEAEHAQFPPASVLIWNDIGDGFAGSFSNGEQVGSDTGIAVSHPRDMEVVQPGDVVRLQQGRSLITLLYRRGANANRLFTTERCNSLCLMCSQPPRDVDDSWRIAELHALVDLIDPDEPHLAVTGGEPTLLGDSLSSILAHCCARLPRTRINVLTNGRAFCNAQAARAWIGSGGKHTVWAVPLYADNALTHDKIVGAQGAFKETLEGLYQLARHVGRVEIRIVLHALSVPRLEQLASYIYRRLPFVEHIAFMGMEPMGFAKINRDELWIDPCDYAERLGAAVHHLAVRGMATSIYNLPLCVLPADLHPFARRSISDWKTAYPPECSPCRAQSACSGFFTSAGRTWQSRGIRPFLEESHELA